MILTKQELNTMRVACQGRYYSSPVANLLDTIDDLERQRDSQIAEAVKDKLQSIHNYDWKAEKEHDCSLGIYKICSELASVNAEIERLKAPANV